MKVRFQSKWLKLNFFIGAIRYIIIKDIKKYKVLFVMFIFDQVNINTEKERFGL